MAESDSRNERTPDLLEAAAAALSVGPKKLLFAFSIGKSNVQSLQLGHSGSIPITVAFKVRTSNPYRYSCRPATGLLRPGTQQQVSVKLSAQCKLPADYEDCDDRFKVFFHPLDPLQVTQGLIGVDGVWPKHDVGTIVFKIKCAFTPGFMPTGAGMRIAEESGKTGSSRSRGMHGQSSGPQREDHSSRPSTLSAEFGEATRMQPEQPHLSSAPGTYAGCDQFTGLQFTGLQCRPQGIEPELHVQTGLRRRHGYAMVDPM